MSSDMDREAFENLMRDYGLDCFRHENGAYSSGDTAWAQKVWQAALLSERTRLLPVLEMAREALSFVRHRDSRWHDDDVVTPALSAINEVLENQK